MAGQPVQYMPGMVAAPVPANQTIMVAVGNGRLPNFAAKTMKAVSICRIIMGCLLLMFGIISIVMENALFFVGTPIWCGIYVIVAASIGLFAANRQTKGPIIAAMVLAIISASITGTVLFGMSITVICLEEYWDWDYDNYYRSSSLEGKYVVDSLIIIATITEVVLAILTSVFCCRVVCCGQRPQPVMYYFAGQPGAGQQQVAMVGGNQGQPTVVMVPQGMQVANPAQGQYAPQYTQQPYLYPQVVNQPTRTKLESS